MIEKLEATGLFRQLDIQFARFLVDLTSESSSALILGSALASRAIGEGNACLNLRDFAGKSLASVEPNVTDGEAVTESEAVTDSETAQEVSEMLCPPLERWIADLQSSSAVGKPGEIKPLVLDETGRLYLQRYWKYESNLAKRIRELASRIDINVDHELLQRDLNRLFPPDEGKEQDYQKLAALTAVLRHFCVISGGPGTGKTWVVARILELLGRQQGQSYSHSTPVVALTAPTGKAAARLIAAVGQNLPENNLAKSGLSWEGSTVHRLLGRLERDSGDKPDVVIVDEASMADLGLMARLMMAVPEETRVIWLGDKDQLSSVEAGAVLGDVCAGSNSATQDFGARMHKLMGARIEDKPGVGGPDGSLQDCIVLLEKSHRFAPDSSIASISRSVNRGRSDRALQLMRDAEPSEFQWVDLGNQGSENWTSSLASRIVGGFRDYAMAKSPEESFRHFLRFRVLCALRKGPFGVESVNRAIEGWLEKEGLIKPYQRWYRGRPILITRNDYRIGLFNGDVGIVLPESASDATQMVYFQDSEGGVRAVRPSMLPDHETVFAMTVHKSQGSEFDEVLFLLPGRPTRVLSRELLYTGLTRAIRRVEVWGSEGVIREAVINRIERSSGLRDALWGNI